MWFLVIGVLGLVCYTYLEAEKNELRPIVDQKDVVQLKLEVEELLARCIRDKISQDGQVRLQHLLIKNKKSITMVSDTISEKVSLSDLFISPDHFKSLSLERTYYALVTKKDTTTLLITDTTRYLKHSISNDELLKPGLYVYDTSIKVTY